MASNRCSEAPVTMVALTPSVGISTWIASTTPTMAPTVFSA